MSPDFAILTQRLTLCGVKTKLESKDGMSFAEFTYPLLQAWDWWHMYDTKGIQMQVGGSDQFGNIVAGIDAVKYISAHHPDPKVRQGKDAADAKPFGFTVPLLTTSSGEKFGKSAGNAVWLDKEQTSPFDLYKFFLGSSDADVSKYLKYFTFMPVEEIEKVVTEHMENPAQRKAQHLLAFQFVELVHGIREAREAESRHHQLFGRPSGSTIVDASTNDNMSTKMIDSLNNSPSPNMKLPVSLIHNKSIGRVLYSAGLAVSATEGHQIASKQGAYIGSRPGQKGGMDTGALSFTPVKLWVPEETQQYLIDGKLLILRRGKHNIRIIEVVSDEEFEAEGLTAPGWAKRETPNEDVQMAEEKERQERRRNNSVSSKADRVARKKYQIDPTWGQAR